MPHCASLNHRGRKGRARSAKIAKLAGVKINALKPKSIAASKAGGKSEAATSSKKSVL